MSLDDGARAFHLEMLERMTDETVSLDRQIDPGLGGDNGVFEELTEGVRRKDMVRLVNIMNPSSLYYVRNFIVYGSESPQRKADAAKAVSDLLHIDFVDFDVYEHFGISGHSSIAGINHELKKIAQTDKYKDVIVCLQGVNRIFALTHPKYANRSDFELVANAQGRLAREFAEGLSDFLYTFSNARVCATAYSDSEVPESLKELDLMYSGVRVRVPKAEGRRQIISNQLIQISLTDLYGDDANVIDLFDYPEAIEQLVEDTKGWDYLSIVEEVNRAVESLYDHNAAGSNRRFNISDVVNYFNRS